MIEEIRIRNFQGHRRLRIIFDDVTTLVGQTNRGKSSVFRALRWVILGVPNGTKVIRHGANWCEVFIRVDGHIVRKRRWRTKPGIYQLDDMVFKANRNSVPEPIQNLFQMSEHNFQSQLSPPFWLLDSPGQLSKKLNRIINLDSIDTLSTRAKQGVRDARSRCKVLTEQIDSDAQLISELSWVEEMVSYLDRIDQARTGLESTIFNVNSLADVVGRVKTLLRVRERLKPILLLLKQIEKRSVRASSLTEQATDLGRLVEAVREISRPLPTLDLKPIQHIYNKIVSVVKKIDVVYQNINELEYLVSNLQQTVSDLSATTNRLEEIKAELKQRMPKVCPLCHQAICTH